MESRGQQSGDQLRARHARGEGMHHTSTGSDGFFPAARSRWLHKLGHDPGVFGCVTAETPRLGGGTGQPEPAEIALGYEQTVGDREDDEYIRCHDPE